VADLAGSGAVLQQQREQDGDIRRNRVQGRVLLRSVEKYLGQRAIREASDLHPKTMAGVLELDGDRTAPMWQASPGGHGVRLQCCHQASSARNTRSSSEILLRAEVRSFINDMA
jgi:hypothetical protein